MTRVVLDANVLAPAFISKTSVSARLVNFWGEGGFDLIVSDHLLNELDRTLTDKYFVSRIDPDRARTLLKLLRRRAHLTELTVDVSGVATHLEDDLVLSTALSGNAEFLATRDKQLLKLGKFKDLIILQPGELLDTLSPVDIEDQ